MEAQIVQDGIPFSPDVTYFTTAKVRPYVDASGKIHVYNGKGNRRSWGAPQVRSDVAEIDGIIRIEVTGWHKHTVSPVGGTYWFVPTDNGWKRVTANHHLVRNLR